MAISSECELFTYSDLRKYLDDNNIMNRVVMEEKRSFRPDLTTATGD